jgi:hypothetical protein
MATEESAGTDRPRWFFSRLYASVSPRLDQEGMAELRTELLGPLSGEIVEIGRHGRNFGRYPVAVASVTAISPSRICALSRRSPPRMSRCRSVFNPGWPSGFPYRTAAQTRWCCAW